MIVFKATNIIVKDNGKTIGAVLTKKTINEITSNVTEETLVYSNKTLLEFKKRGITIENAVIDSRGFIRAKAGKISKISYKDIYGRATKHKKIIEEQKKTEKEISELSKTSKAHIVQSKDVLIFHGSDGEINGDIDCTRNKTNCDFGNGFYLGDCLEQAENRVSQCKKAVIYAYTVDVDKIKVYEFNDVVLWALFIGHNREKIKLDREHDSKLMAIFDRIEKHDLIVGLIADDKMAKVYGLFCDGLVTDTCLAECLKLVKYGKQYVFKNNKAVKAAIKEYGHYEMTKTMKKESIEWGKTTKGDIDNNIDVIINKHKREGKFIEECLEEFRK